MSITTEFFKEQETLIIHGTGAITEDSEIFRDVDAKGPNYPFDPHYYAKTVIIEEGITEIGEEVFRGRFVQTIQLPGTLKRIGKGAFSRSNLECITLPDGLEEIGDACFRGVQ